MTGVTFDAGPVDGDDITLDAGTTAGTDITLDAGPVEGTDVTLDVGTVEGDEITFDAGPVEGTDVSFDIATPGTGGGGGAPTGAAGGVLSGTYPNPTIADGALTLAKISDAGTAAAKNVPATGDAASGEVVKGDDTRLSDARTPAAHNQSATTITSGTLDIARIPTGTTSTTVAIGNDSRLSDARTPTGAAGGDLAGTYPNPTIGSGKVTNGMLAGSIDATKLATPLTGLYVSGALYSTQVRLGGTRSVAPGALYFWPLDFDGPVTIDGLSINVTTGGSSSVAHLYVVTGSATTGRPTASSTILATCSNIATATSTTRVTASFDASATLAVTRGRLWGAVHAITGTATFQACDTSTQLGPPYASATTYSGNGLSGIAASNGGTSSTALTTLAGISMTSPDVNQGPVIYWRAH